MNLQKLEKFLRIDEPVFPNTIDYVSVANYLKKSNNAAINYYSLIFKIGVLGLILSVSLLLYLIKTKSSAEYKGFFDFKIILEVKEYPAIITSLVTMAFSQIEKEINKKELYSKLELIANLFNNVSDESLIVEEYKKWTWQEFKGKFKI